MEYIIPIVIGLILLFALVVILRSIRIVPQGYHWTVERFGKYTRTITPGLNLLTPVLEAVGRNLT